MKRLIESRKKNVLQSQERASREAESLRPVEPKGLNVKTEDLRTLGGPG